LGNTWGVTTFPLQHYINRRVGEELPQHSLLLHYHAFKKFNHSRSFLHCVFERTLHHLRLALSKSENIEMARVRSTGRVSREGDKAEVTETTPILEVMRQLGLVVLEKPIAEGTLTAEAE
jgi:hypothetical protein